MPEASALHLMPLDQLALERSERRRAATSHPTLAECPICGQHFPHEKIHLHADRCASQFEKMPLRRNNSGGRKRSLPSSGSVSSSGDAKKSRLQAITASSQPTNGGSRPLNGEQHVVVDKIPVFESRLKSHPGRLQVHVMAMDQNCVKATKAIILRASEYLSQFGSPRSKFATVEERPSLRKNDEQYKKAIYRMSREARTSDPVSQEFALWYIEQLKIEFKHMPDVVRTFFHVLVEFRTRTKSGSASEAENTRLVMETVGKLFHRHPLFYYGFDKFLPPHITMEQLTEKELDGLSPPKKLSTAPRPSSPSRIVVPDPISPVRPRPRTVSESSSASSPTSSMPLSALRLQRRPLPSHSPPSLPHANLTSGSQNLSPSKSSAPLLAPPSAPPQLEKDTPVISSIASKAKSPPHTAKTEGSEAKTDQDVLNVDGVENVVAKPDVATETKEAPVAQPLPVAPVALPQASRTPPVPGALDATGVEPSQRDNVSSSVTDRSPILQTTASKNFDRKEEDRDQKVLAMERAATSTKIVQPASSTVAAQVVNSAPASNGASSSKAAPTGANRTAPSGTRSGASTIATGLEQTSSRAQPINFLPSKIDYSGALPALAKLNQLHIYKSKHIMRRIAERLNDPSKFKLFLLTILKASTKSTLKNDRDLIFDEFRKLLYPHEDLLQELKHMLP